MKNRIIRPAAYQSVAGLFDDAQAHRPLAPPQPPQKRRAACRCITPALESTAPNGIWTAYQWAQVVAAALSALPPTGMVNRWAL